jgi:hypothetical protein
MKLIHEIKLGFATQIKKKKHRSKTGSVCIADVR